MQGGIPPINPVAVPLVAIFLAITVATVGIVDIWLSYSPGQQTVSGLILDVSKRYPILPFLVGILIGHLFWPQRS